LDATAGDRAQVLTLLHAVPFLESLDMASLESLVGRLVHLKVPAETEVVRQGQDGDCFYIVRTGTADVLVDGFLVGSVTPGGYFGERALLRNVPRMATVRSREPMELLALGRADFVTALTGQESATTGLAPVRAHPDACELTLRQRVEVLSQVSLLSHLDSGALRQLAAHSRVEQWSEGALVVKEGDEGDRFFVLLEGRAVVSAGSRAVSELLPGDQFGEIALLHGVPRRADVTVTSPSTTMSLPREAFVSAVRSRVLAG
jgi:CRP-like cAMP-binding protein